MSTMTDIRDPQIQPSTTYVWRLAKIDRPLQAQRESPRRGRHAWHRLSPYGRRRALNVRLVKLSGGSLVFMVTSRGTTGYISGDVALYDVWKGITGCV